MKPISAIPERAKVNLILKNKSTTIMKFGSGSVELLRVSYVGSDEHIDEFVLFAK
jgi:hypothetical protein